MVILEIIHRPFQASFYVVVSHEVRDFYYYYYIFSCYEKYKNEN